MEAYTVREEKLQLILVTVRIKKRVRISVNLPNEIGFTDGNKHKKEKKGKK